jgi:hypothetical protein
VVPQAGVARAWAAVKCSSIFMLAVVLPLQLTMVRAFVAPYAELSWEIRNAPVDVVLVDLEGGYYAQDLAQNSPSFDERPAVMDLALIALDDLASLCQTKSISRVDRRHFRSVGMVDGYVPPDIQRDLEVRRDMLDRIGCAPPLLFEKT